MLKLNLGSGKRNLDGFINIDAVKQTPQTIVGDILNLDYEDSSVDEIYSEHVIEHLDKPELDRFFSECKRMLKIGGRLHLIAPCILTIINKFINKENFGVGENIRSVDINLLDNFLYGCHKHPYDYHKQGIYKEKLEMYCNKYNFKVDKIYYQHRGFSPNEIVLEAHKY